MALDFTVKDVIHQITAKFTHAFLPDAKKPFHLKAVFQPELDIHGIASKADVYNIATSPKVIEEGLNAGMELMYYLAADGYKIKTPVFNLKIRLPGEYDGAETRLAEGAYPEARLQVNAKLRQYLKDKVQVVFDGIDTAEGFMAAAIDEATGLVDQTVTIDNLVTIHGYGLKVDGEATYQSAVGVYFVSSSGRKPAKAIAVNENRTLKVIAPTDLVAGDSYRLSIVTQSSTKHGGNLLKNPREVESEFALTAQA